MHPVPDVRSRPLALAEGVGVALLIVLLGALAVVLAPSGSHVAAWWPASGVAVAIAVHHDRTAGRGLTPDGVVVAVLVGTIVANLVGGREAAVSVGFGLANAVEVALAVRLLRRLQPGRRLADIGDLRRALLACAMASSVSGVLIATAVALTGGPFLVVLPAVVPSHLSAMLLLLPFALRVGPRPAQAGRAETVLLSVTLATVVAVVFHPGQRVGVVFLVFPVLVLVGLRLSLRACALQLIAMNTAVTVACAAGWGPLVSTARESGLPPEAVGTLVQALILGSALTVYSLRTSIDTRLDALAEATEARRRLSAVIESATSTAIIQTDSVGVIRIFNEGAVRLLGFREEDAVGRMTLLDLHDPDEVAARAEELGLPVGFEVVVAPVRHGRGASDRRDWTLRAVDGSPRQVSLVVTRVDDADGVPLGYLGIAEDVGAQRQVESLLVQSLEHERALADKLRAADALKTDFVSSVSHELRTPMTSVLGYTEILTDTYGEHLGPAGNRIVERIQRSGRRLLHLVDDLLTLSRIEAGTWEVTTRRLEVGAVLRRAVEVAEPQAQAAGIALRLEAPGAPVVIDGDAHELERALLNLIGNAVKFSEAGTGVCVRLGTADSERAAIEVVDAGIGIPADDLPRLFTRFYRASNATVSSAPGTGLGLAIVEAIVRRHGGTVEVRSKLGAGTVVRVELPLAGVSAAAPAGPGTD
ncbi:ATP-binding protein [Nocardioides sp.]|uniref:ATP-binding protein n=1 Tax=Nocardioides sp. TaxID=35761 RepID=UPI003511FD28